MDTYNPTTDFSLSACLLTTPIWSSALQFISTGAAFIATVCGAIVGVITVYRLTRGWFRSHTVADPGSAVRITHDDC